MSTELNREEAFNWIKSNYKRLQNNGELPKVMTKYMKKYFGEPIEVEKTDNEMLDIFNGEAS